MKFYALFGFLKEGQNLKMPSAANFSGVLSANIFIFISKNFTFQVHVLLGKEKAFEQLHKRIIYLKSLINGFSDDISRKTPTIN